MSLRKSIAATATRQARGRPARPRASAAGGTVQADSAPRQRSVKAANTATSVKPVTAVAAYHHGDLRAALLRAAGELLSERGLEGFTLRECARRAGVSHGAPAHHFGDVAGMLTAYAATGFERMTALMREYQVRAEADGTRQLQAAGLGYVDFAMAHRALFQLMFRSDRLNAQDPVFAAAAHAAFETLASAMRGAAPRIAGDAAQLGDRVLLAWSAVHGFAILVLEGQLARHYGELSAAQFARAAGERLLALLQPALEDATAATVTPGTPGTGGTPGTAGTAGTTPGNPGNPDKTWHSA